VRCAAAVAVIALMATVTRAASATAVAGEELLKNSSIEQKRGDLPADWYPCFVPGRGATLRYATDRSFSPSASLAIECGPSDDEPVSTNWAQRVEHPPSGKTVRLTARVRTEAAESVNVCVQAWDGAAANSTLVGFVSTPVLTGENDWTLLESRPLVLPRSTGLLIVRAALTGKGKAWFDDIHLILDDATGSGPSASAAPGPAPGSAQDGGPAAPRVSEAAVRDELAKLVPGRIVRTSSLVKDAAIIAYLPDWHHNHVDWFAISDGGFSGGSTLAHGGVRALLDWAAPSEQDIKTPGRRFLLALYARRVTPQPTGSVLLYTVLEPWPEGTSWRSQPAYADEPSATIRWEPNKGWKLLDVTNVVRAQTASPEKFHGVMLRFGNEDHVASKTSTYEFASRDAEGEWLPLRPMLLVVDPLTDGSPETR
jgi:hypothetical protein